ncbi:MAG: hypothetical protein Ta2A_13790 [Treponemataceae bacterium]|nr:MAG: hypothetical protein Ta2A_13790 [Treponemataceae bacterium]
MPEAWDSSRIKAQELRLEQWGKPDEVATSAAPMRKASNRREVMEHLKEIAKHSPFTSLSGLTARLSSRSIGKIVSGNAIKSSFCAEAHYIAASNIDKLFSNAIEPWKFELNPNKENAGLKARRYLYAPLEYKGKIELAKITVKEYQDTDLQSRIYSIEALDIELRA